MYICCEALCAFVQYIKQLLFSYACDRFSGLNDIAVIWRPKLHLNWTLHFPKEVSSHSGPRGSASEQNHSFWTTLNWSSERSKAETLEATNHTVPNT